MSEAYDAFLTSLSSTDGTWADDFDLESLSHLERAERRAAETLLLDHLKHLDPRVPRALAMLEAYTAVDPMKGMLPSCTGEMLVETAMALYRLDHSDGTAGELVRALASPDTEARRKAAYWLREFPSPRVSRALLDAIRSDEEADVRLTAATSLMILHGLLDSPYGPQMKEFLAVLAMPDPRTREQATRELEVLTGAVSS